MSDTGQEQMDFTVDSNNLYREDSITDLNVASIRKLVPIKPDGTDDDSRETMFFGHTQLMSPQGPLPLNAPLEANSLEEAMAAFPAAMQQALAAMVERIRKMQEQQQREQGGSNIITPGR
ncbi:MAG: cytoplasmic protein [Planctomycetes bacterium]|nr:cytoplasmic protein [Planctomycetota bacterium]